MEQETPQACRVCRSRKTKEGIRGRPGRLIQTQIIETEVQYAHRRRDLLQRQPSCDCLSIRGQGMSIQISVKTLTVSTASFLVTTAHHPGSHPPVQPVSDDAVKPLDPRGPGTQPQKVWTRRDPSESFKVLSWEVLTNSPHLLTEQPLNIQMVLLHPFIIIHHHTNCTIPTSSDSALHDIPVGVI